MPKQEVFFEQLTGDRAIEVLKSYDLSYARETFASMDDDAQRQLWTALEFESDYEFADLPKLGGREGEAEDFLWEELLDQAREDGALFSFFIVNETIARNTKSLYVSPDWPSAEAYAKKRLGALLQRKGI